MRRSVLTSIRLVPAASASGSSSSEPRRWWGSSKRDGGARGGDAARGAEQGLELARVESRLLGEEVEDPAAVVVDDDDPDRGRDLAQGGEGSEVVEEAEVAGDDRGRPPSHGRCPDSGGDEAVEAVGAAVAEEQGVGVDRPQERLLVADRHARRRVDEVAVGVGFAEGRVQSRLGQGVEAVELGADRLPRRRTRPRSRPPAARDPRRGAPPTRRRGRWGRLGGSPPPAGPGRSRRRSGRPRSDRPRRRPARPVAACSSASPRT